MIDVICYYHDPVKAPLLREAVLPAFDAATRLGATGHVERHWLHGPHVRLRLDGPVEAAHAAARMLEKYLADNPSSVRFTEDELLSQARANGLAELIQPPYSPIYPGNTVRIEPTDTTRLHSLLGSDALIDLRTVGLRLGVDAARSSLVDISRVQVAITAMAVHASRYPPGLANGYHSFLSHLEDFLLHSDPDGRVRAKFDQIWERNSAQVVESVERVATGHPTSQLEAAWQAWTIGMRLAAEQTYDSGDLTSTLNPRYGERAYETGDPATIQRYNFAERTKFSEYHTRLWEVDLEHPLVKRPLTVYRFGTNVLYQLLAICDVTPMQRYLAADLMARATQEITGIGWAEHLAQMERR
ncbi:hypothetical protein JOF56_004505 [Kibdelosporangium banguiense]|uniref:Lantibiotic biosynthesis dehydratase C-term n=1 Tax=Kibdelosporangium banguiense TaxID=1365924 RepID=A0ABS4TI64_9PSEU|nr:lantibiotic dehydratase C-terminal domain-containing protein [Kibdelosporangium banguiense]MBP2324120.1 hypothetical protein [Kibdelosporangium banguiense]